MKKFLIVVAVILLLGLAVFFFILPAYLENSLNATLNPPPYSASERAAELHKKLLIEDVLAIATRPVAVSHTGVRGTQRPHFNC